MNMWFRLSRISDLQIKIETFLPRDFLVIAAAVGKILHDNTAHIIAPIRSISRNAAGREKGAVSMFPPY